MTQRQRGMAGWTPLGGGPCLAPLLLLLLLQSAAAAFDCTRSRWESRLDQDLEFFEENGITADDLDRAQGYPCGGYLVSIVDGSKLYASPLGWAATPKVIEQNLRSPHTALNFFARLLCHYTDIPNVTFVLNTYDRLCLARPFSRPAPVFSWGKDVVGDDHAILVPYETFMHQSHYLERMGSGPSWPERREVAIWRGTTTGGIFTKTNWRHFPRSTLVKACNGSSLCDARFTGFPQATPKAQEAMRAEGYFGEPIAMSDFLQYKYIVVNDGNMAPSSRLFAVLQSGSLVMKQESPAIEFYYGDLIPYRHYVPLAYHHGDIEQKVKWAKHHDKEAKAIAAAGMAYCKRYLTDEHVYCYMYRLLLRYSRAQRFAPGHFNASWQLIPNGCSPPPAPPAPPFPPPAPPAPFPPPDQAAAQRHIKWLTDEGFRVSEDPAPKQGGV